MSVVGKASALHRLKWKGKALLKYPNHLNTAIFLVLLVWLSTTTQAIEIHASDGYRIVNTEYLEASTTNITEALAADNWQPRQKNRIPSKQSQLWLRLQTEHHTSELNGLYISMLGSFDLYLDKRLIYSSGVVSGRDRQEIPGFIDSYITLPEALKPEGTYTWYLRISRDALPLEYRQAFFDFNLNHYDRIISQRYRQSLLPLVSLSAFFTIAVFYFFLWVTQSQKQTSHLLFSLLCLLVASWLLAENWRPLLGFPYDWQGIRLWFISFCATLFAVLLPGVLLLEFKLVKVNSVGILTVLLLQGLPFGICHLLFQQFDLITGVFIAQAYMLSLLIVLLALRQKQPASGWLLLALLICILAAIVDPSDYLEQWFFVFFPLVIIALLYRQSISVKLLRDSRDQALVQTESLKLQLLKKSIQPHFLLNTLTSLSEWIEQSPATALEMVEQLAEEFYTLSTMVDKQRVSIAEEIRLCQVHLRLMSLRNNCDFDLQSHIQTPDFQIPPGILHTLMENAFSHNQFGSGRHLFQVRQEVTPEAIQLNIICPSTDLAGQHKTGTGLGRTYIENRLQQTFPDTWQIRENRWEKQWQTHISIRL